MLDESPASEDDEVGPDRGPVAGSGVGSGEVVVTMRGIVKRFGDLVAVDGASLDLRRGEIHALLGENGAGKTTLMNVLSGLERPDEGVIEVRGEAVEFHSPHDALDLGIGMVHQHFKLVPRLTVAENVILGADVGSKFRLPDLSAVAEEVVALGERFGLPVPATELVGDLSVGEQQRVEILRALYRGARILILDEPTATLTPVEVDQLVDRLRQLTEAGAAIVMITHHLDEVMAAADRITVLRSGANVATVSPKETSPFELARLMVGREVGMLAAVGEDTVTEDASAVTGPDDGRGPVVLALEGLRSDGDHSAAGLSTRRFADIDLEVCSGEIVTIAGVEGNGQSELEEVLLGLRAPTAGRVLLDGADVTALRVDELFEAGVGFIHSDRYRRGMIRELPVAHNLVYHRIDKQPFGSAFHLSPRAIVRHGAELVRRYSIAVRHALEPASSLSGGNAQKVVLARALSGELKLLVAAQPTRGLDVGAIEYVWDELRAQRDRGLAILLITTDLSEVLALSDRCHVMYRGSLTQTPLDREQIGLAMGGAVLDAGAGGQR